MKVALVGNMNNNFFALLRYLRDLGVDAYLLLYENELPHFLPENDTWSIDLWHPYIVQTKVINGGLKSFFSYSQAFLKEELGGYDYYIANGFAPALFRKAGLHVDLFLPYCIGIEYTYFYNKIKWRDNISELIFNYYQVKGLKENVRLVGTIDKLSFDKSKTYKLKAVSLAMPMVYTEADCLELPKFHTIINRIQSASFVVFSHVSHFKTGSEGYMIKRNDIGIEGFAEFVFSNNESEALLVLLDYGPGVSESKSLISSLGIERNVLWLSKMSRKELMYILRFANVGFGEFGGHLWGGTVWEFMSLGKPFFQFVNMDDDELSDILGCRPPKFHNTADPLVIAEQLNEYALDLKKAVENGSEVKSWFNEHNGIELAKKYVDLILDRNVQ